MNEHFPAEQDYRVGGMTYGCRHDIGTRPRSSAAARSNGRSLDWHRAAK
jgi:hypothetical protein